MSSKILRDPRDQRILCITVDGTDYYRGADMPMRRIIGGLLTTAIVVMVLGAATALVIATLLNGVRFVFDLPWSWAMLYVGAPVGAYGMWAGCRPLAAFHFKSETTAETDRTVKAPAARFGRAFAEAVLRRKTVKVCGE